MGHSGLPMKLDHFIHGQNHGPPEVSKNVIRNRLWIREIINRIGKWAAHSLKTPKKTELSHWYIWYKQVWEWSVINWLYLVYFFSRQFIGIFKSPIILPFQSATHPHSQVNSCLLHNCTDLSKEKWQMLVQYDFW